MADKITARNSDAKFKAHPKGQFVAQCVDAIDLGEKVEDYPGTPSKLSHKCALVFRTGEINAETGEIIDVSREFTVSMGELANLRKFLEQWRGKAYTEDQVMEGVPLDKLTDQWALISIDHKTSGKGRTYSVIVTIAGVPKQMQGSLPTFPNYERAKYWEDRKKEYLDASTKFRVTAGADKPRQQSTDFDDFPGALEEDDDLPF
jgi:hypothetical protein